VPFPEFHHALRSTSERATPHLTQTETLPTRHSRGPLLAALVRLRAFHLRLSTEVSAMRSRRCLILCLSLAAPTTFEALAISPAPIQPVASKKPLTDKFGHPLPEGAMARLGTLHLRTSATSIAVSQDNKTLLTFYSNTVSRLDAANGRLLTQTQLADVTFSNSCFSPDGKILALRQSSKQGGLEIWDTD
jgi:hypothetical protein